MQTAERRFRVSPNQKGRSAERAFALSCGAGRSPAGHRRTRSAPSLRRRMAFSGALRTSSRTASASVSLRTTRERRLEVCCGTLSKTSLARHRNATHLDANTTLAFRRLVRRGIRGRTCRLHLHGLNAQAAAPRRQRAWIGAAKRKLFVSVGRRRQLSQAWKALASYVGSPSPCASMRNIARPRLLEYLSALHSCAQGSQPLRRARAQPDHTRAFEFAVRTAVQKRAGPNRFSYLESRSSDGELFASEFEICLREGIA